MERLRGVNFVSSLHLQPSCARRPDRLLRPARRVARPLVRREHGHERVVDARVAARGGHDVSSAGDTAAYWMPTLLVNGQPVTPNHAQIYYRRSTQRHVEAFPPGFRMVAGDARRRRPRRSA